MARKEKQYHFIYKTTNLLNGKYYYGMHSTDNLNDGYLGSGKRLKYSLNKYGRENHKVEYLEFLPNRKSLINREKEIVNLNEIAKEDCMNLMIGGKGGFISEEQQRYRSICGGKAFAKRLKEDIEFRNVHAMMVSKNIQKYNLSNKKKSDTFTNKRHTDETKRKMSLKASIRIGNKNSQFGTCWINKNEIIKKIKCGELSTFIENGWIKGRKV
jgi:hypothetical protein